MNKRVQLMVPGDVFVGDNDVTYVVVGCGGSVNKVNTRTCLRVTHNLTHRVDSVPFDKVGRCIDWHELDQRVYEYQRSIVRMKPGDVVLEHDGQSKVVSDGPRAKHINEALDKAGVPNTFNGNDAILFDRVEWLINQRNRLSAELATATDELRSTQALLTGAGVPIMVNGRRVTLHEGLSWLISSIKYAAPEPTQNTELSSFSEGLARINKALEQLKPAFDAMAAVDKLREAMEQCSQNAVDKLVAEPNTWVNNECNNVRSAGREMVRKAWELIQAARVTVGNKDVQPLAPRHEPASLLDVFQFVQQQHELADRELCNINEDDVFRAERVAYLRGLATAYVHMMALIAALGIRGFELVQHKPNK